MILSVCPNPALQRTLWFSRCQTNQVNRAIRKTYTVGGKGVNVARVVQQMGGKGYLFYLSGGGTGLEIERLLQSEHLPSISTPVGVSTRICSTLIDIHQNTLTEIVEESEPVTIDEVDAFLKKFKKLLQQASMVILSGTVPPGFQDHIYAECLQMSNQCLIPVIVDASKALLLSTLPLKPFLIKPNYHELAETMNLGPFTFDNLQTACKKLSYQGAQNILVTHESEPAWFYSNKILYRLTFPNLDRVNSIGSGDAIAAGVAIGLQQNQSIKEAIRLGVACGCANVLTETAGSIREEDVTSILPHIQMDVVN